MAFYCVRCAVGQEPKVRDSLNKEIAKIDVTAKVLFPKKIMIEKKLNQIRRVEKSLLPGYVLMYAEAPFEKIMESIRPVKDAYYFLHYGSSSMYELIGPDLDYASWVFGYNGLIKPSRAILQPGHSIKVIDGPLKGQVGNIVSVSKHDRRATIRVPFGETEMKISLAVEFLAEDPNSVK